MSVRLLDANMLIALAWPVHAHHAAVAAWFNQCCEAGWATCPLTEAAFIRVSANPRMLPQPTSPRSAMVMLNALTSRPGYEFWPDDFPLRVVFESVTEITGHNQITDAYLLSLVIRRGGKLVTLDSGISALLPRTPAHRSFLELVTVD